MSAAIEGIQGAFLHGDDVDDRRAERTEIVRVAEYSAWPRSSRDQRLRVGFTGDASRSGLQLTAPQAETVGELLHVAVRDVSGRAEFDSLARVVWCRTRPDGRFAIGLALLETGKAVSVRRAEEVAAISA